MDTVTAFDVQDVTDMHIIVAITGWFFLLASLCTWLRDRFKPQRGKAWALIGSSVLFCMCVGLQMHQGMHMDGAAVGPSSPHDVPEVQVLSTNSGFQPTF